MLPYQWITLYIERANNLLGCLFLILTDGLIIKVSCYFHMCCAAIPSPSAPDCSFLQVADVFLMLAKYYHLKYFCFILIYNICVSLIAGDSLHFSIQWAWGVLVRVAITYWWYSQFPEGLCMITSPTPSLADGGDFALVVHHCGKYFLNFKQLVIFESVGSHPARRLCIDWLPEQHAGAEPAYRLNHRYHQATWNIQEVANFYTAIYDSTNTTYCPRLENLTCSAAAVAQTWGFIG